MTYSTARVHPASTGVFNPLVSFFLWSEWARSRLDHVLATNRSNPLPFSSWLIGSRNSKRFEWWIVSSLLTPGVLPARDPFKNNFQWLTPSFNQHVVYKWLCTSGEREIGYIKFKLCQPPSASVWWNHLCCIRGETGQSSSTPNPWIKAKSYRGEICSAPGNPLWMWGVTAHWFFLGVVWLFCNESRWVKTLFPQCSVFVLEKHNHQSVFNKNTHGSVTWVCFWDILSLSATSCLLGSETGTKVWANLL